MQTVWSLDSLQQSHSEHHAQTREDLSQTRRLLESVTRERDSALQELAAHGAAQRHAADEVERATAEARSLRAERERLDHTLATLQVPRVLMCTAHHTTLHTAHSTHSTLHTAHIT